MGSSNSLSRRLDQYFTFKHLNQDNSGKLLPFIQKEGFSKFSLEIFVLPTTLSSDYSFLFLEQYYLLHKSFNLNIQRIVNFIVNQGTKIYLYDLDGKTLYYSSKSLNQIQGDLGIHPNTCRNCLKEGKIYLNFFKITNTLIKDARMAGLNNPELFSLISEKKILYLSQASREKFSLSVVMKESGTGKIKKFSSIIDIIKHFKNKNIIMDRNKIAKVLNTGESYKGYIFIK